MDEQLKNKSMSDEISTLVKNAKQKLLVIYVFNLILISWNIRSSFYHTEEVYTFDKIIKDTAPNFFQEFRQPLTAYNVNYLSKSENNNVIITDSKHAKNAKTISEYATQINQIESEEDYDIARGTLDNMIGILLGYYCPRTIVHPANVIYNIDLYIDNKYYFQLFSFGCLQASERHKKRFSSLCKKINERIKEYGKYSVKCDIRAGQSIIDNLLTGIQTLNILEGHENHYISDYQLSTNRVFNGVAPMHEVFFFQGEWHSDTLYHCMDNTELRGREVIHDFCCNQLANQDKNFAAHQARDENHI